MPQIFVSLNGGHFYWMRRVRCSRPHHSWAGVIVKFCSIVKLSVFFHCTKATPQHFPVLQHPHNYRTQCKKISYHSDKKGSEGLFPSADLSPLLTDTVRVCCVERWSRGFCAAVSVRAFGLSAGLDRVIPRELIYYVLSLRIRGDAA